MGTRRAVLQTGLIVPLAAACAPDLLLGSSDAVRIGVPWSGAELGAFRAVVAGVRPEFEVEIVPLGDNTDTAFRAGGRSAPDVVMLPQARQVRELAERGKLRRVDDGLWTDARGPRYAELWREMLYHEDVAYGVPFKAADKSLVWFDREQFSEYGLGEPSGWTVTDWGGALESLARQGIRLLALGAADGWVLNDVFENALLAESGSFFDKLATASPRVWDTPEVRTAFARVGAVWWRPEGLPGGVGVALTRQFPDAVRQVFEHRRAVAVVAPDFAEPIVRDAVRVSRRRVEDVVGVVSFPAVSAESRRPKIVGGDVMVVTRNASARAADLVAALADPAAPLPWITRIGGFLSPNLRTAAPYSSLLASSAREVNERGTFDLSEQFGPMSGRAQLSRVLTEFLIAVGERGRRGLEPAIDAAVAALDAFERRR